MRGVKIGLNLRVADPCGGANCVASDAMQHPKPTGEPCQSEGEERQRGRKGDELGRKEGVEVEISFSSGK